jgi:hypothetical protein
MSQGNSPHIDNAFPNLQLSGYKVTSPVTPDYNCIAWACEDTQRWWQPPSHVGGYYWPIDAPQEETLRSWTGMFRLLGYSSCKDEHLEPGFEKIAIYTDADDWPTHVAKQLPSGMWTSKLGAWEDIEHSSPTALEGDLYGTVAQIMKRQLQLQGKLPL